MTPEEQSSKNESLKEEVHQSTANSTPKTAVTGKSNCIGTKDLLVPISVVIAGAFIGLGLYLGGGQSSEEPIVTDPDATPIQLLVQKAGASLDDVEQCMNEGSVAGLVQSDYDNAVATGGRGTPWSVVIGPSGKTYPINGAQPLAAINQTIELARADAASPVTEGEDKTDQVLPVTDEDHIKGSIDAPIKIVEYSDFDCPFCGRFHDSMNQVVSQNDDVAWVYRHFPLDQLHPNARTVAQISECVAEISGSDAFWTFTDGYFAL